jgi:agmatinase
MYRWISSIVPFALPVSVYAQQFAAYGGGNQVPFWAHTDAAIDEIDLSTYDFSGIGTYAHVPYENCFVNDDSSKPFDIAILGAPFDTVRIALTCLSVGANCLDPGRHCKTRCEIWAKCYSKRQPAKGIWI